MPEVIIKYKSARALKALQDLTKLFDMVIEKPVAKRPLQNIKQYSDLPITFSKEPDVTALAGIWERIEILRWKNCAKMPGGFKLSHNLQIPDAIIGAMSIVYDIELFTYNTKDFKFLPGIKLYKNTFI